MTQVKKFKGKNTNNKFNKNKNSKDNKKDNKNVELPKLALLNSDINDSLQDTKSVMSFESEQVVDIDELHD